MFMFTSEMERVLMGITIFLTCFILAQSQSTFDITKYGAKPGSDIAQALLSAWGAACGSATASKVVIPAGTFPLKEVMLKGPCKAPVGLQVQGTVLAPLDPAAMTKNNQWITVEYVEHFTLSGNGGIFDGQGSKAWSQNTDHCSTAASCNKQPNNFAFYFVNHSTIMDITSKNSKLFHFLIFGSQNVTFSHLTIKAPGDSPNTDGIHIGHCSGITIADTTIKTGDDCVSIGDGCKQINITRVNCGPGHGISVGSLGRFPNELPVEGIFVTSCNISNTMFGVRIKTWAGCPPNSVTDVHFENIKMQNVSNPVVIDQLYCTNFPCKVEPPSQVKIRKVSIKGITGSSATPIAMSLVCSRSFPCQEVVIGDINLSYTGKVGTIITNCTNVQATFTGKQNPPICAKPKLAR